jgi:subtilisin-like proprotein convertase family protein
MGQIFSDVEPGSTFYEYVQRLASRGIIGGYACGGVNPGTGGPEPCDGQNRPYYRTGNEVTRGQVAKIAVGAFFPSCAAIQPTPPPGTTPTPSVTPVCSTGTFVFAGPQSLPDIGSFSMPLTFSGGIGTIQDVDFAGLDITHGWIGDLRVTLRSPAGTQTRLVDQICNGGPYINFTNITLDDNASQGIGSVCPPAAGGTYRPSEPLSIFNGQDPNGDWSFYIEDLQSGYAGTLNSYTLRVTTCPSGFEVNR